MLEESNKERTERILKTLKKNYPGKEIYTMPGGLHFVCEVEPTHDHLEYDRAVEVIIKSKPHKHLKATQEYKIISGNLRLYINGKVHNLSSGDTHTTKPEEAHWAESDDECIVEIYSTPGWTKEDHIVVNE